MSTLRFWSGADVTFLVALNHELFSAIGALCFWRVFLQLEKYLFQAAEFEDGYHACGERSPGDLVEMLEADDLDQGHSALSSPRCSFSSLIKFEMALSLVVMGVCMDDNSYLRDTWNQLDFFIVAASLFDMALSGSGLELQAFLCYMFGLLLLVFAVGLGLLRCFLCRG